MFESPLYGIVGINATMKNPCSVPDLLKFSGPGSKRVDMDWRIAILLFMVTLYTYVFFRADVFNPNIVSRVALAVSIVEDGTLTIDRYAHATCDKSFVDGHYYCDKAPGGSFLVLPAVAGGYAFLKAIDVEDIVPHKGKDKSLRYFVFLETVAGCAVALICASAVAALYLLGRLLSSPPWNSLLCALLFAIGTPYWYWSTILFGHSLAAAFLIIATYLGCRLILRREHGDISNDVSKVKPVRFQWVFIGFLLAYAVWTEYPVAVPACILGTLFLCMEWSRKYSVREIARTAALLFLGALPVAVFFAVYNNACFGGPLTLGYEHEAGDFPEMFEGFFGIKYPDPEVLWKTLFTPRWGIFWYSPFLVFSPVLAIVNIFTNRDRGLNIVALAIPVYHLLLNASYAYWMETFLPCRHTAPCLPFAVLPFFTLYRTCPAVFRKTVFGFACLTLAIRCVSFFLPQNRDFYLENLPAIAFIRHTFRATEFSLSSFLGCPDFMPLVFVVPVWSLFAWMIWKELNRSPFPKNEIDVE